MNQVDLEDEENTNERARRGRQPDLNNINDSYYDDSEEDEDDEDYYYDEEEGNSNESD